MSSRFFQMTKIVIIHGNNKEGEHIHHDFGAASEDYIVDMINLEAKKWWNQRKDEGKCVLFSSSEERQDRRSCPVFRDLTRAPKIYINEGTAWFKAVLGPKAAVDHFAKKELTR